MAKILVVDDNASNRKLLVALLGHEGHWMIEASDGADGLEAARAQSPDLVISDILMPTMDGFEFVRSGSGPRERESHRRPAVVLCAVPGRPPNFCACCAAIRCFGYLISKPLSFEDMAAYLGRSRG
jgi:CheY-like chemotaxis protein